MPLTPATSTLLRGRNSIVNPEINLRAALQGDPTPSSSGPLSNVTEIKICRTASELTRTLQGKVGLSGGLAALPIPLLQFRREFQQSLKTTIFSVSLVVQARRILESLEVVRPSLLPDVAAPSTSAELDKFVSLHGDSWVSGLQLGAEVQGVFTLYAQSREEADAVANSLEGIVPLNAVTLSPSFAQEMRRLSSDSSLNVSFKLQVKGMAQPVLSTPEDLLAFINRFGSLPIETPEVLSLQTRGYEELPELLEVFQPVVANRQLFCDNDGLQRQTQRLAEVSNQCRWVDKTLRLYGLTPDPSLANTAAEIQSAIKAIDALADSFHDSASAPLQISSLPNLTFQSPRLVPSLITPLHLGGDDSHGDPFDFEDRAKAIPRRRRLAKVILNSGRLIDQIRLTYVQDPDVNSSGSQPKEWTEAHPGGEGRGKDSLPLELDLTNSERIITINANTGTGVDELELITSSGQRLKGGNPSKGGTASSWTTGPQQVLIGFQGRAKTWLDALQPVVADFSNALRWEEVDADEDA